ncbi:MAG: MarR family transcriptional regulator [Oscillospiraceae bacterium]|jgi:DNA-binding MarR family transcriptional regulator|nr:MarR family transcriptional regulator [Oscillospiraceae bacterium]
MHQELLEKLARLQWLLHKQRLRGWARGGPMADVTRGQGRLLAFLKLRDGISTKDLSYLLGMRISSLNELLAKLEKSGFIVREPSEEDKRVMLVKLTEKGKQEQQPEPADGEDPFSCLTAEEQQTLGALLDRISGAMQEALGGDEDRLEQWQALRERFAEFHDGPFGGHFSGPRGGCRSFGPNPLRDGSPQDRDGHDPRSFRQKGWGGHERNPNTKETEG